MATKKKNLKKSAKAPKATATAQPQAQAQAPQQEQQHLIQQMTLFMRMMKQQQLL